METKTTPINATRGATHDLTVHPLPDGGFGVRFNRPLALQFGGRWGSFLRRTGAAVIGGALATLFGWWLHDPVSFSGWWTTLIK